jgi:autotransporter-associated beta strand protein
MTRLNLRLEETDMRSFVWFLNIAIAALMLLFPPPAQADVTWTLTGTGDWSVATNWSGAALPTSTDNADIYNGGTATITTTGDVCSNLYVGNTLGGSAIETSGCLTARNDEYIAYSGTGNFQQSGGTNQITSTSGALYLGYNSASSGAYGLSGSGQLSAPAEVVGYSGTGNFTQSGGTNVFTSLYLGDGSGGSGTYSLGGSGFLSASSDEQVGYSGTGTFTQSGGTNALTYQLFLGSGSGGSGTYNLSGSGQLSAMEEDVGLLGAGNFTQTGGTNTASNDFSLGVNSGGSGTYSLAGTGQLSAPIEYVGWSGTGNFTHSGGTNSISIALYLGCSAGGSGTYSLSGSGLLSAPIEYVGSSSAATALFQQTGGTNSVTYLSIGGGGRYLLSGGTLQLNGGVFNAGVFDGGNGPGMLSANCLIDLTSGTWQNLGGMSVSLGANSLLVVPPGFNPSTGFGSYTSLGLPPHTAGTTLVVPAGQGFGGWGSINDPVNCQGTITAAPGYFINLANGLMVSGTGTVTLGSGTLTVSDTVSGISGGAISAYNENIGAAATGLFTQTGGINSVTYLSIGSGSRYQFSGGTLQINGGDSNAGVFDGGNSLGVLSGSNCILDLSTGTLQNVGATSVNMGANSLLIVPAGFNPSAAFGSYVSLGLTHTAGTTLVVSAGQGFGGWGSINDPVVCQGTISASPSGFINLNNGLALSGTGTIVLGSGNLTVNDTTSGMSGGSLSANSYYIGNGGTGLFSQSGGTNGSSSNCVFYLGYNRGDSGAYSLSGPAQLSASSEYVGYSGTGNFTQSGGINTSRPYLYLGYGGGSSGNYSLSGNGQLSASNVSVGYSGTGSFAQSGGYSGVSSFLYLGQNPGSSGSYSLSGSGGLMGYSEYIGYSGAGTFTQSGGTNEDYGHQFCLGYQPGSSGTYSLGAGLLTLTSAADEFIGCSGTGTFTQSGGTNQITYANGIVYLGYNPGSVGTYSLSGNGVDIFPFILSVGGIAGSTGAYSLSGSGQLSTQNTSVGVGASGTFTQSGGTHTTGTVQIGAYGGQGTYCLSGGLLSSQNASGGEYVGQAGTGTFTQSGGTNQVAGELDIGDSSGGNGTYNQLGGVNQISRPLYLGWFAGGTGTYNLNGGTLILAAVNSNPATAAFNFGGGTLQASGSFTLYLPMTLTGSGGNATVDTAGYAVTLSGSLSGPGGLTKTDGGTLILSAANTYTGPTAVNGGILSLTGALSATTSLAVGGGTFSYAPSGSTGKSQTVAGLTVNAGLSGVNASASNTLALAAITRNTGGVVDFNSGTTGTITTTRTNTNGILGPWATYGSGTSLSYAAENGSGAPYAIVAYTGATPIASGVSGLTDTTGTVNYTLSGGGGTLAAAVTANTIQFTGGANTITASAAHPLSLNGIMNDASGTAAVTGGNLVIGSAKELVFTGPGNMTVASVIQDNPGGASALTMAGSGTLVLSASNTYSGPTTIDGGTLQMGSGGTAGSINSTSSVTDNGLLVFDLSSAATFTRTISGNGGVTQMAPSILRLTGTNTYNGPTTISTGTIQLGSNTALGSSSVVSISGGAVLDLDSFSPTIGSLAGSGTVTNTAASGSSTLTLAPASGSTTTFSGVVQNGPAATALTLNGAGMVILAGANTYTGPTTISSGTLQLNNARAAQNSTVAVNGNSALAFGSGVTAPVLGGLAGTVNVDLVTTDSAAVALTVGGNNASTTYTGTLSGSGSLTKAGTGALTLSGPNTYTGGTIVEAGILVASNGANGSATGSGTVTLSGGTLASGSGGGSIEGVVEIESFPSVIAPGGIGSIGTLTIGSLITASDLTLNFDLTTPAGNGDLLVITRVLEPGLTTITFGTDPTVLGNYRLIGYETLMGNVSEFDLPAAPSGLRYSLSTTVDPGYIDLVVVPEPSTLALLGVAAIGLIGWTWRRRAR